MNVTTWVISLAGLLDGAIIGSMIVTPTEIRARTKKPSEPKTYVFTIVAVVRTIVVCTAAFLISMGILHLGEIGHLGKDHAWLFGVAAAVGAVIGKFGRYLFWRFKGAAP